MVQEDGMVDVDIKSAGIYVLSNGVIPKLTLDMLKKEGIEHVKHKPTQLNLDLIKWADLILVMEQYHMDNIRYITNDIKNKVVLITEYTGEDDTGIPDPFGNTREAYETCVNNIKRCLRRLLEKLKG
jgi:protein-tyrosine phosphatase